MAEYFTDVLTDIAEVDPDLEVYTFVSADGNEQGITARQLYNDASRIAGTLSGESISPQDVVVLSFDHGYDVVAAFWGALFAGTLPTIYPYFPKQSSPDVYLTKLKRVACAAGATSVIAPLRFSRAIRTVFADDDCRKVFIPPTESADMGQFEGMAEPVKAGEMAYIQFSSGTTGLPKGIRLTHNALLHYMEITKDALACTSDDVTVGWLPLYHDMGLITQMLHPLYCRQRSVFINPADWLANPQILFQAIDRYGGSISWMPNFAFNYCTRRITDEQVSGLDLSSWRILGCGSEPVQIDALDAFKSRFSICGLQPGALKIAYGLAEHVAGVTLTPHDGTPEVDWVNKKELGNQKAVPAGPNDPDSIPIMSCGYPKPTVLVRIANDEQEYRNDREVGEVLLKSPSLFSGYHRSETGSAEALKNGWLHTGDLGYVVDGQLYIVGRKKDLIIIGGNNIQPSYIESIAESVLEKACRYSAAFGIYDADIGSEKPVLVCEMRNMPDDETAAAFRQQIRKQVRDALDVFLADICLVEPGWIKKTTSGKISRSDTRDKYLVEQNPNGKAVSSGAAKDAVSLDTETVQQELAAIWKKLFRISSVTIEDNFFELGGDSFLAIQLVQEIEDVFHCSLPVVRLFESPSISGLAEHIISRGQSENDDIVVCFRPGDALSKRPKFFCVHGISGGILAYRPLAMALGDDQPFYGIQPPGLTRRVSGDQSIEGIAAEYVIGIKSVQPFGPYHIGGYCFGGIIAYEMCRQLAEAGEKVALLAIIEGYPPSLQSSRSMIVNEWIFAINFIRNLPYWIRDYIQLGRVHRRYRAQRAISVIRKRLMRMMGFNVTLSKEDIIDGIDSFAARYQYVTENNIRAIRNYRIKPFGGRLVLFRTPHRVPGRMERPDRGWGKLAAEVAVQMIPGCHLSIGKEPNVQVLADRLKIYLPLEKSGAMGGDNI